MNAQGAIKKFTTAFCAKMTHKKYSAIFAYFHECESLRLIFSYRATHIATSHDYFFIVNNKFYLVNNFPFILYGQVKLPIFSWLFFLSATKKNVKQLI